MDSLTTLVTPVRKGKHDEVPEEAFCLEGPFLMKIVSLNQPSFDSVFDS